MKRFLPILLLCGLLLTGCSLFEGSYVSVTRHENTGRERTEEAVSATDYASLCAALRELVRSGRENRVIHVAEYDSAGIEREMSRAVSYILRSDPIGAYAVEDIEYEFGTSNGLDAIAVEVLYRHSSALQSVLQVADMEAVRAQIGGALERCDSDLVLLVDSYKEADLQQLTEDYALAHPDTVMEVPTVTFETYPEAGASRVLELRFSYQNSRDTLRNMKQQVSPVFASAALYVSGDDAQIRKFSQLSAFLRERFGEYQLKTSLTPAYSLLRHGVGDSKAFATVYARMCIRSGLECHVITGTRSGEAWCWNLICCDGQYYHVDLLSDLHDGTFCPRTDPQMERYVWDYSAYPESTAPTSDAAEEK